MARIDLSGQVALPEGVTRVRCRFVLRKYDMWNMRFDGRFAGRRLQIAQAGTGYVNTWNMACEAYGKELQRMSDKYGPNTEPGSTGRIS